MMPTIETAEILAVGSELLTPFRIDTNSLFLTGRLNDFGIVLRGKGVVGDERADLADRLRQALDRVDLVITTGGLGPTDDDLTRDVVAELLGRPLRLDQVILSGIENRFARRGIPMPAINRRQAMVPDGATVMHNERGTAPGLILAVEHRLLVLLPGPPREMQPMFNARVAAMLSERTGGRQLQRRVLKVTGRSESQVEEVAHPIYSTLTDANVAVQTTILATPGQIELHLAAGGSDHAAVAARLDTGVRQLAAALGPPVFSTDGRTLEAVVGDALRARGWRIAVAESCTGGWLGARLTEVAGSSAYVTGGVIAYDNAVKIDLLGVAPALIASQGAVSEAVAVAMATGAASRFGTEVGAAITGIAGPGGGTSEKPVGMVCVAVAVGKTTQVRTHQFPGDREAIRRHATSAALEMVRRALA